MHHRGIVWVCGRLSPKIIYVGGGIMDGIQSFFVMNKILQEGINQCAIFGRKSLFLWDIEIFQFSQAVPHEDVGTSCTGP